MTLTSEPSRRPERAQAQRWAEQVQHQRGGLVYATSFMICGRTTACLCRDRATRTLALIWDGQADEIVEAFSGRTEQINLDGHVLTLKLCPTDPANSQALRRALPFTRPGPVGLSKSFGCGDRLGLATPGHILAAVRHDDIRPILAQQSIREMHRTNRTPQQVMDDACWGVFQSGYDGPFGSDADHLKTHEDIDGCAEAGFGLFTIDPGDHVDDHADSDALEELRKKFDGLPWDQLRSSPGETMGKYGTSVALPTGPLSFSTEQVLRAAVKYGRAIAHTVNMYQYLVDRKGENGFELEMSVDETATPTSPQEHYYVAGELKRLGVTCTALAPRFVGDFEKGVDYIGDLKAFRDAFAQHAAIAKLLGPYKLSVHSGSDKFSIYPIVAELAGSLIHVKTAGTSYLEALRVLGQLEPGLFREILDFARERYETDRASYHVSAELGKVPAGGDLADHQLPALLEDFHAREVLHVTFGSVMTHADDAGQPRFKDRIIDNLLDHEEAYHHTLDRHIGRHMDLLTEPERIET